MKCVQNLYSYMQVLYEEKGNKWDASEWFKCLIVTYHFSLVFSSRPLGVIGIWQKRMTSISVSGNESMCYFIFHVMLQDILSSCEEIFKVKHWESNSYIFLSLVYCRWVVCNFPLYFPFFFFSLPPSNSVSLPFFNLTNIY